MSEGDEIEITPEMIEAGVEVLRSFNTYFEGEQVWARRVFQAMCEARSGQLGVLSPSQRASWSKVYGR